jgi:hypothetical protein
MHVTSKEDIQNEIEQKEEKDFNKKVDIAKK